MKPLELSRFLWMHWSDEPVRSGASVSCLPRVHPCVARGVGGSQSAKRPQCVEGAAEKPIRQHPWYDRVRGGWRLLQSYRQNRAPHGGRDMFILSCGRSSVSAPSIESDGVHTESLSGDRRASDSSGRGIPVDRGASERGKGEEEAATRGIDAAFRRVDSAISHYDSMAVRLKTANRADFPALWSIGEQKKRKETMPSSPDSDEMPVPDLHVGLYQCFCQPLSWSRAFASPGDFTIRMESVTSRDGEVYFNIAVVCCSVKAVRDDVSISDNNKRKSYVKYVERSETELVKLSESMALKYLGHRLMAKVPKSPSLLTSTQKRLDEYAEDVCVYLSDMLSIREIGYNGLVKLSEPVVKNLLIREFFDLSLGLGDPGLISTSSCDARIERRADERPLLPSAWLDNDDFRSVQSKSYTLRISPHEDPIGRSFSRLSDSGYDFRLPVMRSPRGVRDHGASASSSKCIRYVLPTRWHAEKSVEGAFTVEITSVTLVEGYAQYLINVLYQAGGGLEVSTVDRRYSDFEAMVCSIEAKLRTIPLRHIFPAKTFFRSTDVRYLERRAAYLQLFLEKLLSMSFVGVLDQKIQMAAEPNLRKFLELPAVEWSIVPRDSTVGVTHKNGGVVGGPHRRFSTFAMSPTIGMESPPLFVFNARQAGQQLEARMPSYPVQFPFRSRSDSL